MIAIKKKGSVIYMVAKGKLDGGDYDKILPKLKDHMATHRKVCWYVEMQDFEGWMASAHWKGVQFDIPSEAHLKKVALVGTSKWKESFTGPLMPFSQAHIKYFKSEDSISAKRWIEN